MIPNHNKRKLEVDSGRDLVAESNKRIHSTNESAVALTATTSSIFDEDCLRNIIEHLCHAQPQERIVGTVMVTQSVTAKNLAKFNHSQLSKIVSNLVECLDDRAENVRIGAVDALWHLVSLSDLASSLCVTFNVFEVILSVFETYLKPAVRDGWDNHKFIDVNTSVTYFSDCFNFLATIGSTCANSIDKLKILQARYCNIISECFRSKHLILLIGVTHFMVIFTEHYDVYSGFLSSKEIQDGFRIRLEEIAFCFKVKQEVSSLLWLYLRSMLIFVLAQHINTPGTFFIVGDWTKEKLIEELAKMVQFQMRELPNIEFDIAKDCPWTVASMSLDLKTDNDNSLDVPPKYENFDNFRLHLDTAKRWWRMKRNLFELLTILTTNGEEKEVEGEDMVIDDDSDGGDKQSENGEKFAMEVANFDDAEFTVKRFFEHIPDFGALLVEECQAIEKAFPIDSTGISNVFYFETENLVNSYKLSMLSLLNNLTTIGYLDQLPQSILGDIWNTFVKHNSIDALSLTLSMTEERRKSQERLELITEAMNTAREMLTRPVANLTIDVAKATDLDKIGPILAAVKEQNGQLPPMLSIQIVKVVAILIGKLFKEATNIEIIIALTEELVEISEKQSKNALLLAEVLDSLIDLYSVDDTARVQIAKNINLGSKIRKAGLELKRLAKSKRIKEPVVITVKDNVLNFAEYLENL